LQGGTLLRRECHLAGLSAHSTLSFRHTTTEPPVSLFHGSFKCLTARPLQPGKRELHEQQRGFCH
jgi:hypothetical protein